MKHVSPYVTFMTGLFMVAAAIFYTLVIADIFPLADMDRYTRLVFFVPAMFLTLGGTLAMIYSCIMLNKLRFSATEQEWVE